MMFPNQQQHGLDDLDILAQTVDELEPDEIAAEGVRGGAFEPYLATFKGQKQGASVGCPPPAQ